MAIVSINNYLDEVLEGSERMLKGPISGIGAVVLTNPLDFLHMEYMKAEKNMSILNIIKANGFKAFTRGMGSNMVGVTIPISITIFVSDILKSWKYNNDSQHV